jgi:hypothetical protein
MMHPPFAPSDNAAQEFITFTFKLQQHLLANKQLSFADE